MAKKKKLTPMQTQYKAQQNRLKRRIREMTKKGFTVNYTVPEMPIRVTQKALEDIRSVTANKLYGMSTYTINVRKGTTISGYKARELPRKLSAQKGVETRKRNIATNRKKELARFAEEIANSRPISSLADTPAKYGVEAFDNAEEPPMTKAEQEIYAYEHQDEYNDIDDSYGYFEDIVTPPVEKFEDDYPDTDFTIKVEEKTTHTMPSGYTVNPTKYVDKLNPELEEFYENYAEYRNQTVEDFLDIMKNLVERITGSKMTDEDGVLTPWGEKFADYAVYGKGFDVKSGAIAFLQDLIATLEKTKTYTPENKKIVDKIYDNYGAISEELERAERYLTSEGEADANNNKNTRHILRSLYKSIYDRPISMAEAELWLL